MGGQDDFSRSLLGYESTTNTLMAGFSYKPTEAFRLDLNATYTKSEAALDPFELRAPDYEATHPTMSFDFSQTHTNSDLDVTRVDALLGAKYRFTPDVWMYLSYRYADYADDAPYLYDTSGTLQVVTGSLGWKF